ncbi:MAG: hypothetical protein JSU75_05535 [Gammaproteobacteria bacterium]|nr:MAG: hypothetical protein JSU75_05535 [Gammaproteobacteria bacterium]
MIQKRTLLIFLCALSLCAPLLPAQEQMPSYALSQLAEGIADGPAVLRSDLAQIALDEMALEYAREAEQARTEMRRWKKKASLARWSGEVQKLADHYADLAVTITPATPIDIRTGPDGSLYLHVAGQLVVVTIPRMNEQYAFEQQIAARFCEINHCADLVDEPVPAVPAKRPVLRAKTLWSFSQDAGPTCSSPDGLEFMYRNTDNLGQKRETCARVVGELKVLAKAIEGEIATGARVDWQRLAIHTLAEGGEQVILNGTGDTLVLSLPTLAPRPELLKRIRPWLTAKVNGTPYTLVILHAEQLLAPAKQ